MRNISENITYTNINLITSSRVHGVFVLLRKEGRKRYGPLEKELMET